MLERGRSSDKQSGKQRVRLTYTSQIIDGAMRAVLERDPQALVTSLNELESTSTPDMVQQYLVASIIAVTRSLLVSTGDFTPVPTTKEEEPSNEPNH